MERALPSPALMATLKRTPRDPEDLELRRQLRAQVVRNNAFEFAIAASSVCAVLTIGFAPGGIGASPVGHLTASLVPLWLALFGVGAALIVIGLLKLSPRLEVVGLLFFTAAMITDGVAVLVYTAGAGATGAFTFLALSIASCWRVHVVLRLVDVAAHRIGEHER